MLAPVSIRCHWPGLQWFEKALHCARKGLLPVMARCILGGRDHTGAIPDSFERWTGDQLDQDRRITMARVSRSTAMAARIEATGVPAMGHPAVP